MSLISKKVTRFAIAIPASLLLVVIIYFLPPVRWRVDEQVLKIKYALNPPEAVIFQPQENELPSPAVEITQETSATPRPTSSPTPSGPTATLLPSPVPSITPTALPGKVNLSGVRYEDQHGRWNYCAPANLAMALSFWGWEGNRDIVGPAIKPDPKDKNVMPYEMVDYVNNQTNLRALSRVGGNLDTLRRFLAAGVPVLIEKAAYFRDLSRVVSWMGHYQVLTGYDETRRIFIAQDSFTSPDYEVPYEVLETHWRAFNNVYILIYSPDKETEVQSLLGQDFNELTNYQLSAEKAASEIYLPAIIDQFYAWFNRGTNLMYLQDYAGASQAYDQAFSLYPSIPENERPWRMLWYQTGPYFAYFYAGRYWDTLNLADTTLNAMQSEKNLEESYYWRGMAKNALGDTSGAIEDFKNSLIYHPGFKPALYQLDLLGVETD